MADELDDMLSKHRQENVSWVFHQALTAARRREHFMRQARLAKAKKDRFTASMAVGFARGYQREIIREIAHAKRLAK